jgi:SAM-dependent methyltransferase
MSLARLHEHRAIWQGKPVLAEVYRVWFDLLLGELQGCRRVLEVGAGPGFLSEYVRRALPGRSWLATDVLPAPWNDLVADGLRLPFRDGGVDGIAAMDLIHHLARPATFFTEAARVLGTGGRIVAVEPWVTPLSYPVYRWLHQEGCDLGLDPWRPFGPGDEGKAAFDGDAAVVYRVVKSARVEDWARMGFEPPRVRVLNAFGYLLSLGFREQSLLPRGLAGLMTGLDAALQGVSRATGMRALLVWRRTTTAAKGETGSRA